MTGTHATDIADSPAEAAVRSCCADGDHSAHGYLSEKKRYLARLKRIEGQVRGIHRMVDEEQYCIDILTQISAVNSALRSLSLTLLDDHLHHCVLGAAEGGPEELDRKLAEAQQAITRLVKS
ncbi:metal-sensitive transcriptional regulator [Corynebacterium sp. 335C]